MLIRFTVENFLSFKDEVEFSMVAGKPRKHPDHILPRSSQNDLRLLKTAVIYGANASGKTNLVKAMRFARDLIVKGTRAKQQIATIPFRFYSASEHRPSRFQFEIRCDSKIYSYEFEVDNSRVYSEKLTELRASSEKCLFERKTDRDENTSINFGDIAYTTEQNDQFLSFVAKGTRPNQLFLTECIERNVLYFESINHWFANKLVLIFPTSRPEGIEIEFMNNEQFQSAFVDSIKKFDLGIEDISLEEFDFSSESRIPGALKGLILDNIQEMTLKPGQRVVIQIPEHNVLIFVDQNQRIEAKKFMTRHRVDGTDELATLDLTEESDGTQRVFEIVPALIELLSDNRERVFVIDELDRRLHALLSYKILELFLARSKNLNSQLIVTTHEVMVLDLDLLRRDEIWFIEKDAKGASSMFSLEEFQPRYDRDIRKSYLQGRFGAIPLLPSRRSLELQP